MPVWVWIALVAGLVATVGLIAIVWVLAYRATERRYVVGLIGDREAITATGLSLEDVVTRMCEADDDAWHSFANDPDSVERHVLAETAARARLVGDELDTHPMPKSLIPVAEALGDAAYVVGQEAGKVQEDMRGDEAIDALASVDLERVRHVFEAARAELTAACEACRVEDESVYGGGLYL